MLLFCTFVIFYILNMAIYYKRLQSHMNDPPELPLSNLKDYLKLLGEPDYRYYQIIKRLLKGPVKDFEKVEIIPSYLRISLIRNFKFLKISKVAESSNSQSKKIVFKTYDNYVFEAVLLTFRNNDKKYKSLCISCQSGCPVGCKFCWTGKRGFGRNLTVNEIAYQLLYGKWLGENVRSISFMGMGEPLLNYDNVKKAIEIFSDKDVFGLSKRKINVSTVGILSQLQKLCTDFNNINIAYSLHTPFQRQRNELIPVGKYNSIEYVFKILDKYINRSRRKVFIGYLLLDGINDSEDHLEALIKLVKNRPISYLYNVNLIQYNCIVPSNLKYKHTADGVQRRSNLISYNRDVETLFNGKCNKITSLHQPFRRSRKINYFYKNLLNSGIKTTIRQSFGEELNVACGQMIGE